MREGWGQRFSAGDLLVVTPSLGASNQFLPVTGIAQEARDGFGWAYFSVRDAVGLLHEFNLNQVLAEVIYCGCPEFPSVPHLNMNMPGAEKAWNDEENEVG